ncbi:MAG: nucleotidyltransferase family protein [Cellulosilyticaceae bacterium]
MEQVIEDIGLPTRFSVKLQKDIAYILECNEIEVRQIILFGSCARGTYKVTSDIDLLVITEESVSRVVRGDIACELDEEIDGVRTDVVFYAREVFEASDSLLCNQIKKEGIILYRKECVENEEVM